MFARPFRLGLERLDDRNAPSSLAGNDAASSDWMPTPDNDSLPGYSLNESEESNPNPTPANNQKPVITNFSISVALNLTGRFSGKVVDEHPGGLTVILTGPQGCLNGSGQSVTTDADGNFEFVGQLVHVTDSGTVTVDTADTLGLPADQVAFSLTV